MRRLIVEHDRAVLEYRRRKRADLMSFAKVVDPKIEETAFHSTYYDVLTRFAKGEIRKLIITVPPQHGKEISDCTPVPTPKGFKRHGELRVGDYVFGRQGEPIRVEWVSPKCQSEYIVTFSDGETIECHGNHEWVVHDRNRHKEVQVETKYIAMQGVGGGEPYRYRFQVDAPKCIEFESAETSIDPYTLGAWLGDGTSRSGLIHIGNGDVEIVANIPYNVNECIGSTTQRFRVQGLTGLLKRCNLLNNKHIPQDYIHNSTAVRLEILAGLIDTDGYVHPTNGRVVLSNTNYNIIQGAVAILKSLGQVVTVCSYAPTVSSSGIAGRKTVYQVGFNPSINIPTRVPRKITRRLVQPKRRSIVSVERKDGLGWGNCIQVEGGVYLVGHNYVPTHNSQGSSRLLPAYMLGLNPDLKIAVASYGASLALKFSRQVARFMNSKEYKAIFSTRLPSRTDKGYTNTAGEFDIVNGSGSLMAVGRGGALTGNRVDCFILDDLYKDALEANSPTVRDSCLEWYSSVVKTRQHNDSQELVVFTRWHEEDLIGSLIAAGEVRELHSLNDIDPNFKGHYLINFEAIKESAPTELDPRQLGEALWDDRHSAEYLQGKRAFNPHSFECLYQGNPSAKEGYLYSEFQTYSELPPNPTKIANYTDTADTGQDYLCSICYQVIADKIYITDVLYTTEPMEITEGATAQMLRRNNVREAHIESNNGGRGFARVIQKMCPNVMVDWFHQSANKESRITTNAASVLQNIYMPADWRLRFPQFYLDIIKYKRIFTANKHDDAADALTGIVEREIFNDKLTVDDLIRIEDMLNL